MTSLAQRHFLRVRAQRQAEAHSAGDVPVGSAYHLMMAKLVDDKRRLKDIQSVERKIEAKRGLVAEYGPYLDGVLLADSGQADEVVCTLMVWNIDAGNIERGLELAAYVIKHDLQLPQQYERTAAVLLLDEVSDAVLTDAIPMDERCLAVLQRVAELVDGHDAPDQARAKLHRALGLNLAALAGEEPRGDHLHMARAGLAQLERAVKLNSKVGAKKDIEQLQRTIKRAEASSAAA